MQQVMETPAQMASSNPHNISLAVMIDLCIQRTYHELIVLADLLPRKTDMERKIEIVNYAHKTRQLFVRLLSLVKWAKNGCKIDKCMAISTYLDRQALLYADTANQLAKLARETLVHARLPAFSIPVAVDVLTSGTYPRLPTCIKEKIIPPDPISSEEEKETLKRLTQIIEYRLVTSEIPHAFKDVFVSNGRVKLTVDKEFAATLTVVGDTMTLPWRLLEIDILVQDSDSRDGKPLVHALQVQYLHSLIQSRLLDTDTPLLELYSIMHSFCQSLQLEVLFSQSQKLIHEQLNSSIHIDQYIPAKKLVVSYWRQKASAASSLNTENRPSAAATACATYKIDIHVNENEQYKRLIITHTPTPPKAVLTKLPYRLKSHQLSIEKILLEVIHAWSYVRLNELMVRLQALQIAADFEIYDLPPTLTFKIVKPCMEAERVCITVDGQSGIFLVSLAHLSEKIKLLNELQTHLNLPLESQKSDQIKQHLVNLKLWLGVKRSRMSALYMRTLVLDSLPLANSSNQALASLKPNVLFVKVPLQEALYVVVEVLVSPSQPLNLEHNFYLLPVTQTTYNPEDQQLDMPKLYLKPGPLSKIDVSTLSYSQYADSLMEVDEELLKSEEQRRMESCYFVNNLVNAITHSETRSAFAALSQNLTIKGIVHQGIQADESGAPSKLTLLKFPSVGVEAEEIQSCLMQATIRLDYQTLSWVLELLFSKNPLQERLECNQCLLTYEFKMARSLLYTVEEILSDWRGLVRLNNLAKDYIKACRNNPQQATVYKYTYTSLMLCYGTNRNYLVTISWHGQKKQPNSIEAPAEFHYSVTFGMLNTSFNDECHNPHMLTASYLENLLNTPGKTLHQMMQVVCDTLNPLIAIYRLPEIVTYGLQNSALRAVPLSIFTVLVESATYVRVCYRQMYVLAIKMHDNGMLSIRDGAYSLFDSQPSNSNYSVIQGLKSFLANYVELDQSQYTRGQSMADDENAMSPSQNFGGMDAFDTLFSAPFKPASPIKPDPSPKPMLNQGSVASPSIAASPLGGFGSPLDIALTSPALPLNSPAVNMGSSPAGVVNITAASPAGLHFHNQGTPQGMDITQVNAWMNSPTATFSSTSVLSPKATSSLIQAGHSPTHLRSDLTLAGMQTRMMPQKSSVGSMPTYLTHSAFAKLLIPGADHLPPSYAFCSPLERFLGCTLLKRHLTKILTTDNNGKMITNGIDPGTINWCVESIQFKAYMSNTYEMLQLAASNIPDQNMFSLEDLDTLERYFCLKVVSPPYKPNNLLSFCRMVSAPTKIVRDFIQIIRRQLMPDMNYRWRAELCLTLPLEATRKIEKTDRCDAGVGAFLVQGDKILYVLKFTRNGETPGETLTQFSVPFLYIVSSDHVQLPEKIGSTQPEASINASISRVLNAVRQNKNMYPQQFTEIYYTCLELCNLAL